MNPEPAQVHVGASTAHAGVCCYCNGVLAAGQERRLVWLQDREDPDDLVSAHAHIRCPI